MGTKGWFGTLSTWVGRGGGTRGERRFGRRRLPSPSLPSSPAEPRLSQRGAPPLGVGEGELGDAGTPCGEGSGGPRWPEGLGRAEPLEGPPRRQVFLRDPKFAKNSLRTGVRLDVSAKGCDLFRTLTSSPLREGSQPAHPAELRRARSAGGQVVSANYRD